MAEHLPLDSPTSNSEQPVDPSSDEAILNSIFASGASYTLEVVPGPYDEFILGDDPDRLLNIAKMVGAIPTKPNQAESKEDSGVSGIGSSYREFSHQSAEDNINPRFYEFTRTNEDGLIEIDVEKLEKKFCSWSLDETTEDDPSKKEQLIQSLREKVLKFFEVPEKDKNFVKQTEPEKDSSTEEKKTEEFTPFKYERKNKLWDRKPHLREVIQEFLRHKFHGVLFTEEALETCSNDFMNYVESYLNPGLNILRRIACPKLCEKHFSSEFALGKFVEEDESVENISISVDHFEFLDKELPMNFLELLKREDFQSVALDLEKDPKINSIVPSFIEFLKSSNRFQFPENCFTLILTILKNPYRKLEVFYDPELPVVNEPVTIAEYLVSCLLISEILDDEDAYGKLAEAIINFANKHTSFLANILVGFANLLSEQIDTEFAHQIYCKVLNLMTSIGTTIIDLCLPQHFEKISHFAANNENCDLYSHLLRACKISIANTIKHDSRVNAEFPDGIDLNSSDDVDLVSENIDWELFSDDVDLGLFSNNVDLVLFYTACYNYFNYDFTTRLIPVFKKYEKRKNREEQYLSKKHSIFPTKDGYMDTEMEFLTSKNKNRVKPVSSKSLKVNECTFNYAGKVLFSSSKIGYVIQEDTHELSIEDHDYWTTINEFV